MHHEDELEGGTRETQPMQTRDHADPPTEELEPVLQMVAELNTRFGTNFDEHEAATCILDLEKRLSENLDLRERMRSMKPDEARLAFDQAVTEILLSMFASSSKLYKQMTENQAFAEYFARHCMSVISHAMKKGE